jgi:hypothetical protein
MPMGVSTGSFAAATAAALLAGVAGGITGSVALLPARLF